MPPAGRPEDSERPREFKAEFFRALAHPLRVAILEVRYLVADAEQVAVGRQWRH